MGAWLSLVPVVAALLGAVAGGLLVHRLTLSRESVSVRRSQRVDHLISAYRRLIDLANRSEGLSDQQADTLEAALSDIVLLGEPVEVEAAREFMVAMAQGGGASLDNVIVALRTSLRRELGLTPLDMPRPYNLRIEGNRSRLTDEPPHTTP